MKFPSSLPASLLAVIIAVNACAEDASLMEQVQLTASPVIKWEGRNHETLDALKIGGPLSIRLESCTGIVISSCELNSIELIACKEVTIRNCWIHDSERIAVEIGGCQQVTVEGCRIENVMSGVYAVDSKGIRVIGNFTRNVKGPFPRGQMAQFDKVSGADNVIRDNYAINELGKSYPEDVINIYQSRGTKESPILIENNYLVGDPEKGSEGKSPTGSGIILGDGGGENILCRRNVIISAGQVGMGISGGHDIRAEDNLILGLKSNVSNTGLYVWNQSKMPSDHVTVTRNRVNWVTKQGQEESWWNGGGVEDVTERDNRFADATLATSLPPPPSQAPFPPNPWTTVNANGTKTVRLPWKTP